MSCLFERLNIVTFFPHNDRSLHTDDAVLSNHDKSFSRLRLFKKHLISGFETEVSSIFRDIEMMAPLDISDTWEMRLKLQKLHSSSPINTMFYRILSLFIIVADSSSFSSLKSSCFCLLAFFFLKWPTRKLLPIFPPLHGPGPKGPTVP